MNDDATDPLSSEAELALAWSDREFRMPMAIAFQLDRRLARIVARTQEPMLGQMRLAWWCDALGRPMAQRPRGDAVLDGIGMHWEGREAALVTMVNAWELLVSAKRIDASLATAFGAGRGAFFAALAAGPQSPAVRERLALAGCRWALADAAAGVSDAAERAALIAAAPALQSGLRMPRGLRGLAVLEALALRALQRGGRPLLEGRSASLIALRAAIFRK
jgi:phytoene synthase